MRSPGAAGDAGRADIELLRSGQAVIGFSEPLAEPAAARTVAERGVSAFSMELIPRITRAQSMDALSSMATIAGYKAVLLAADALPRMFPMMMTAAGTITPARVFVIGAGVAGLQAIASARRLGARVEAYDVRPAVKEQVESLGANFVELPLETSESEDAGGYAKAQDESFYRRQRETMTRVVANCDVVVTTALIPGKTAPILVTAEMVAGMAPGSVVVDLAAERGGNCALTKGDEVVVSSNGVTILGPTNLTSTVPYHASQMYAKNVSTLLLHLTQGGELTLDLDDEITAGTLVSHEGRGGASPRAGVARRRWAGDMTARRVTRGTESRKRGGARRRQEGLTRSRKDIAPAAENRDMRSETPRNAQGKTLFRWTRSSRC